MIFRVLKQIFDQLPVMTIGGKDYKPVFDYGTKEQLVANLSLRRKTGERYYPLIYLETPIDEGEDMDFRFILATMNKRVDMRNNDRLHWTFEDVLEPLRDNMVKAVLRSGVFRRSTLTPNRFYMGEKHFNYHMTPDIWDAIVYNMPLRFDGNCKVKKIYFNSKKYIVL